MRIDYQPKLDFADVLIRPKRSEAPSRSSIVLEREYRFLNSKAIWKGVPIVAANMDTVGTMRMALALAPDMMTCLHKHYEVDALVEFFQQREMPRCAFMTVGIKDDELQKLHAAKKQAKLEFVCIDVANG